MKREAIDILISDTKKAETSHEVKDILCMYKIGAQTSEPNHQHQHYVEWCIGHIKDVTNRVLTFSGPPRNLWLLCLMYVIYFEHYC